MDDVDAVQAQIARNMLSSGDWTTARLDGVPYLEKAPLIYWAIAGCYKIFGAHDWAARLPVALSAIALALITAGFAAWAFGRRAACFSGLVMATCVGLFLFTRIQIPDVMLTAGIALSMWGFLRAIDPAERHPRLWIYLSYACLGAGLLLKSLIGVVFPVASALIYLLVTRQFFSKQTWSRLHPFTGTALVIAIAAPWHILATVRNPPYFALTLHSGPGEYHGFLWFFFINEQLLRFLNMRYPRDYNTVPRALFWGFHLLWLFPWSVYFPALFKLSYKPVDRAGKARLLALIWIGFILVFFTFSTTQEYYSMPCYPALALLLGCAMAAGGAWIRRGNYVLSAIAACCAAVCIWLAIAVWNYPTPGDISRALQEGTSSYTLSLDHMLDLTFRSFAYLKIPLLVAGAAFAIGAVGMLLGKRDRAYFAAAVMMVIFFQAARLALVVFDPYLSSRPLANALLESPPGTLVIDHHYYTYSSVFFYTDRKAWLLNGRFNNLVYGSYAPGAPDVFLNNAQFRELWQKPGRTYLVAEDGRIPEIRKLVAPADVEVVRDSGGKSLVTNQPAR